MPKNSTNPSSLWGKPIPANLKDIIAKEPRMATEEYEDDFDPETADAAAELDGSSAEENYLETDDANEAAYAEAEAEPSEDDDVYDAEAGDDADVEYVNDNAAGNAEDPSRDDDVAAAEQPVKKKKKGSTAMKKRGSDYIREEIAKRRESGDSLRGVDIVNALAKKKVVVSAAQVSQLLKAEGVQSSGRGRKPAAKASVSKEPAMAETASRPAAQRPKKLDYPETDLPLDQLKAASAFLEACGGDYDAAASALSLHRKVGSVMTR